MRKTLAAVAAVTSALLIAACSSSGSSSSSTGSSASATSGSGSDANIAAAKAYQAQFLGSPTSIGISTPLNSKPAADKLLVGLDSGSGSAVVLAKYWAQAAADLGWKYKDLQSGTTPASQQAAMASAIQLNPAAFLPAASRTPR